MSTTGHIGNEKYVSFTSVKRNGDEVSLPVWIVQLSANEVGFTTEGNAWKVQRVRANAQVSLQPCDFRGRVLEGSSTVHGTARVATPQENPQELAAVEKAVKKKYGIVAGFVNLSSFLKSVFRRKKSNDAAIIVRLSL
ncbi:MAG: PPOX class F420-dependent oxidoreductase [Actinomycetes bacterium]